MIIMGATEDFRSSTNPIKRNNFFINLSYYQPRGMLRDKWIELVTCYIDLFNL